MASLSGALGMSCSLKDAALSRIPPSPLASRPRVTRASPGSKLEVLRSRLLVSASSASLAAEDTASAASAAATVGSEGSSSTGGDTLGVPLKLACPICQRPMEGPAASSYNLSVASRNKYQCKPCNRRYKSSEGFVDTVISSGSKAYLEPDLGWGGSSTFQNPLVSFVYERGWRQGFSGAGFPGPDEEWRMASEALKSAEGQAVLDVSCGSGLFTRRMAASGLYSQVIAIDFSETMLRQTKEFIQSSSELPTDGIALVRADVARLPFESGSVAGVHAGAALHCWPSPHLAVAEICRILKPGGTFAATTFLSPTLPFGDELVKPFRKARASQGRNFKRWEPEELEELTKLCGLVEFRSIRQENFIFLSAKKKIVM